MSEVIKKDLKNNWLARLYNKGPHGFILTVERHGCVITYQRYSNEQEAINELERMS